MADIFVNVNLEPGPGVDARLFFPGATSAQIAGASINGNDGLYYYNNLNTGKQYEIDYTGK